VLVASTAAPPHDRETPVETVVEPCARVGAESLLVRREVEIHRETRQPTLS
jgi:hypothetical protein